MKLSCIDILWTKRKNIHRKINKIAIYYVLNVKTLENKAFQGFFH